MSKYIVKVFVCVDLEDEEEYSSIEEANSVVSSLEMMSPENRYEVVEVECG